MAKLILASMEELKDLKLSLEAKFPHSLVVHGYIDMILRYNLEAFNTKVFKAADPKLHSVVVVLGTNSKDLFQCLTIFFDEGQVSKDELASLLSSIPDLDNKKSVFAFGCVPHIADKLELLVSEGKLWPDLIHHDHPDGCIYTIEDITTEPSLPSGMWFGCLDKNHTDLVQKNWRYGYSETREAVAYHLEELPSAAVFVGDGDSAHPVSWIQSYRYGSIGNTFTLPEYRRKGLAIAVTLTLARRVAASGRPVYLMIEDYNEDSKRMHEKMGFKKACPITWHFFLPPGVSVDDV